MTYYQVFMADGTYIEIEADGFEIDGNALTFYTIPADETYHIAGLFNLENIAGFCEVQE